MLRVLNMVIYFPNFNSPFSRDRRQQSSIRQNPIIPTLPEIKNIITVAADGSGDTDTIQEALNMITNTYGGSKILIKEGLYSTDAITLNDDFIVFEGVGGGAQIRTKGTTWLTLGSPLNEEHSFVVFRNLRFDTNVSSNTFHLNDADARLVIDSCMIDQVVVGGAGSRRRFVQHTAGKLFMSNCYFHNGNELINYVDDAVIVNCIFHGTQVNLGSRNMISNCHISNPSAETQTYSIAVAGDHNTIQSCVIDGGDTANIWLEIWQFEIMFLDPKLTCVP
jgi:hypothetical protein